MVGVPYASSSRSGFSNPPNVDPHQPDNVHIVNHGTLNYGGVHYHPTTTTSYAGSSNNSSRDEASWMDNAGSFLFGNYRGNDEEDQGARRSFWL